MERIEKVIEATYPILVAETTPEPRTEAVTILSGSGILKAGTILGVVKASGKYTIVDGTKDDGSQNAKVILSAPVDATATDVKAVVYTVGVFNPNALTVADADTVVAHKDELHLRSIFFATAD